MPTFKLDNFRGVVKDVGFGKQPVGTVYNAQNMVLDKQVGSFVTRNGYSAGLTAPASLTTLDYHLTKPVTVPSSIDQHLYFGKVSATKKVWAKPCYHNGNTPVSADSGWVDLNQNVDLSGISSSDVTVNASPTNTLVIANADSTWGLDASANAYKNWVIVLTTNYATRYLVKSYSVTAHTATFVLDNVIGIDWASIPDYELRRFFHDKSVASGYFVPQYTSPACYSNQFAIRWSGGASSSVDHKACWFGYLDKTFFPSDATYKHLWQGSYAEVAECLAPVASSLLKSMTAENAVGTMIITNTNDFQFDGSTTNWSSNGTHSSFLALDPVTGLKGLLINATGDGDATNNRTALGSVTLASATNYKMKFYFGNQSTGVGSFGSPYTLVVSFNGVEVTRITAVAPAGAFSVTTPTFTVTGATGNLTLHFVNAPPCPVLVRFINIYGSSGDNYGLDGGNTYSFYATAIYDGYQESNLSYLGRTYLSSKNMKITNILRVKLGDLNKRITGFRLYYVKDVGDTTLSSNTERINPAYFFRDVYINDSTITWNLNTVTGYFEYTDYFTDLDERASESTWEEKTARNETTATSVSYGIAEQASGKTFLAQFYDYIAGKTYTNTIQFNGFNGDGLACEDIFPNDEDEFQEKILSGAGVDIQSLLEYQGDLLIWKDASFLKLITSESLYVLKTIDNNVGGVNNLSAQKISGGVMFGNFQSIFFWDGGLVKDILDGLDKYWWQTASDGGTLRSWIDKYDRSFNLQYVDENYVKLRPDWIGLLPQVLSNTPQTIARLKDGSVYFATDVALSFNMDDSTQDSGANIPVSLTVGNIVPVRNAFVNFDELVVDVNVGTGATIGTQPTITFKVDETTIQTYTPTLVAGNNYLRWGIPAHKAGRSFSIEISEMKATLPIAINAVETDYTVVQEYGDARVTR